MYSSSNCLAMQRCGHMLVHIATVFSTLSTLQFLMSKCPSPINLVGYRREVRYYIGSSCLDYLEQISSTTSASQLPPKSAMPPACFRHVNHKHSRCHIASHVRTGANRLLWQSHNGSMVSIETTNSRQSSVVIADMNELRFHYATKHEL